MSIEEILFIVLPLLVALAKLWGFILLILNIANPSDLVLVRKKWLFSWVLICFPAIEAILVLAIWGQRSLFLLPIWLMAVVLMVVALIDGKVYKSLGNLLAMAGNCAIYGCMAGALLLHLSKTRLTREDSDVIILAAVAGSNFLLYSLAITSVLRSGQLQRKLEIEGYFYLAGSAITMAALAYFSAVPS